MVHEKSVVRTGAQIHRTAYVGPFSEIGSKAHLSAGSCVEGACVEGYIGADTKVWRSAHVMMGARVGHDCMVAQNVFIADGAVIGDRCRIQNNTCVSRRVTLEADVYIGAGVMFCNSRHPTSDQSDELLPITVKKGASIGCNACIMGGVTIGEGAMVGALAVVTKDVPAGATVVGQPAQLIEDYKKERIRATG